MQVEGRGAYAAYDQVYRPGVFGGEGGGVGVNRRMQDGSHGFDIADVALGYCQEARLNVWADSFGAERVFERLRGAREGCAGVFVAQAGGEA